MCYIDDDTITGATVMPNCKLYFIQRQIVLLFYLYDPSFAHYNIVSRSTFLILLNCVVRNGIKRIVNSAKCSRH